MNGMCARSAHSAARVSSCASHCEKLSVGAATEKDIDADDDNNDEDEDDDEDSDDIVDGTNGICCLFDEFDTSSSSGRHATCACWRASASDRQWASLAIRSASARVNSPREEEAGAKEDRARMPMAANRASSESRNGVAAEACREPVECSKEADESALAAVSSSAASAGNKDACESVSVVRLSPLVLVSADLRRDDDDDDDVDDDEANAISTAAAAYSSTRRTGSSALGAPWSAILVDVHGGCIAERSTLCD